MKMPGFRPGKVPTHIVRQQYGEQARHEALTEALGQMLSDEVTARQLRVAGSPKIEPRRQRQYDAYRVFGGFRGLSLRSPWATWRCGNRKARSLKLDLTEVDSTLDILRKQRVRYELVERSAAAADRVSIDFLGKKDGEPFAGGEGKDYRFVLGEGKMLSDFENAVIGTGPGEAKIFRDDLSRGVFLQGTGRPVGDLRHHRQGSRRTGSSRKLTPTSPEGCSASRMAIWSRCAPRSRTTSNAR
jgi:trigger factor